MASDESSMSSKESRIQQFGLYRSIDARTEEFLRLSRKRQIRQGCACAAASTAITVTVVIVIFFVYEFSLNSGTNSENLLKSGWLSLMNDTSEDSSFDPKLTKANIDRTTLKLLPLLIKAIKKNAVLEKLLDDQSSSSPFYDKKDTKEDIEESDEQNYFTRNWLKMPSTKLYAIEYKTSPVVYYRDPTKNIEYYTKIRKIRDYQRVFNYVDKMISEKVYVPSSRPIQREESHTESNLYTRFKKGGTYQPPIYPITSTNAPTMNAHKQTKLRCKCHQNLGKLLQKIFTSIQNLLPESDHNQTTLLDCEKNEIVREHKTTTKVNNLHNKFSHIPFKLLMITPPEESTSIYPSEPQKSRNTFTTEADYVTESYNLSFNNKIQPMSDDQFTIKTKNNSQIMMSQKTFVDNYKNIIDKKQIFRRPELISNRNFKNILAPIFDGIEYDDYSYYTSTLRNKPIINNNKIQYMATKSNYVNDIMLKNYNKRTISPKRYKKRNKSIIPAKKSTILDMQVVDNKIALVKTKPTHTSKTNTILVRVFDNVTNTPTPSTYEDKTTTEDQITFDLVNSKTASSDEMHNENFPKSDKVDLPFNLEESSNLVTLKPIYFSYSTNSQDDETIYHLVKNGIETFLSNKLNTTPILSKSHYSIPNASYKPKNMSEFHKSNKTDIYLLIENHVNTLLRKNLSSLKSKLKKTKAILQKVYDDKTNTNTSKPFANTTLFTSKNYNKTWFKKFTKNPNLHANLTMMHKSNNNNFEFNNDDTRNHNGKELSSLPDRDDTDDEEFLISEITTPPENSIFRNDNETLLQKKSQDLTWQDLTNEFMPAWRSIIPSPTVFRSKKPLYLGYHKTDDKPEYQEDDFSINSNFYDINL